MITVENVLSVQEDVDCKFLMEKAHQISTELSGYNFRRNGNRAVFEMMLGPLSKPVLINALSEAGWQVDYKEDQNKGYLIVSIPLARLNRYQNEMEVKFLAEVRQAIVPPKVESVAGDGSSRAISLEE
jgi:hypothetical protein